MSEISLEKINRMYEQVRQIKFILNGCQKEFEADTHIEEYSNPFNVFGVDSIILRIKEGLMRYLIKKYEEAFCSNVPVQNKIGNYMLWFDGDAFDATQFIDRITELVFDEDPELQAYNHLLARAKRIMPYYDGRGNILKRQAKNVIKAKHQCRRHQGGQLACEVGYFEAFSELILSNDTIFHKVAPTQLRAGKPISRILYSHSNINEIPEVIRPYNKNYIDKAIFYKRGWRIDFHFHTPDMAKKVIHALAGDPPNVYFPKHEIDIDKLFQKEEIINARVVKRNGG